MKFILLVEGDAERIVLPDFFRRWLNPKLKHPVSIKAVKLSGSGGYLKEFAGRVKKQLCDSDAHDLIAVIGLLDLYGLPQNFYPTNLPSADERYAWAKRELESRVGQARFRQFFAVHELEAWLLSDPTIFPREVRENFPAAVSSPESVNFNQPPGVLLERLYGQKLKKSYQKTVHGNDLFAKLDPETACQKCPHLRELLDEMLDFAKQSGN
ncbi:MAG TPA: DUF4276 family protein [Blastocatellia bacterium]|nr:DUF4276 family protein [Blastocatellia bacterium]HMV83665.1 DUF4276 family protein [Blastocatellia bacterium]HMX24365.1 DUF4276 family protein [Blastocatellia bacterium]HMY74615.1 DUF4276 family protein [Blastocatellia bacterium]HMZ20371.1 DUF4276 family protein [Blastocatellia bacterium]